MERVSEKVFGVELLEVSGQPLVGRYNVCLERLGIAPTALESFRVDAAGWSPEIAEEKNDTLYLSAGVANPMAVIVSPDQRFCPLLSPCNSYDRDLLDSFFEFFPDEIADITRSACIGLDIDQGLSRYQTPCSLLLVDYIIVRSYAGELTDAALRQRKLVSQFNAGALGWFDASLRRELIDSAELNGDLRYRKVYIPDMRYSDVQCFYSQAFEGTFVLRDAVRNSRFLVLECASQIPAAGCSEGDSYAVDDPKLLGRLFRENWIEVDLNWYKENPEFLQEKREYVVAHALFSDDPEIDYRSLTSAQKKRKLTDLGSTVPEVIHELEHLTKQLSGRTLPTRYDLSPALQLLLLRPDARLNPTDTKVLWRLISKLQPLDLGLLHRTDLSLFFKHYADWSSAKQSWVQSFIEKNTPSTTL